MDRRERQEIDLVDSPFQGTSSKSVSDATGGRAPAGAETGVSGELDTTNLTPLIELSPC